MSKNIVKPRTVSFEEALRNLASRLTGRPAADLPRTQEAIVQYMAENIPSPSTGGTNVDALGEAVIQKVMARIRLDELVEIVTKEVMARTTATEPTVAAQDGAEGAGRTISTPPAVAAQDGAEGAGRTISTPPAVERPQEPAPAVQEIPEPKITRKNTKAKVDK